MSVPPDPHPNEPDWRQGSGSAPQPAVCVRHPKRQTGLRCTRCDRPACPECLREAAVGYQCVDCVDAGRRTQRNPTTVAGAALRPGGVVIPVLIALNVVVFAITAAQAGSVNVLIRSELFRQLALYAPAVAAGQLWRLLTSGFLHFGLLHLGVNMLALWIIGRDLETVLGRARFLAVYFVSLLGGSALVFLLESAGAVTAGASGAIFGLIGGLLVVLLRLRRSPRLILGIIAINVIITFTIPNISIWGHLGGLAFGTAATAAMVYAPRTRRTLIQAGALAALAVVIVLLVLLADARYPV